MSQSSRYWNFGQSATTGNSMEMEFRYNTPNASTNYFKFGFSGNGVITVLNSGNVGIGQSSPAYTLDVNGTSRVSGDASFSASIISPKTLYYRGSGGTGTGTGGGVFPTNFTAVLSNMGSALTFTSNGATLTSPYACAFAISFSGAASNNNSIGTANIYSNLSNSGSVRNDLLLYDAIGSGSTWRSYSATIPVSAGEALTITVQPQNGVTYQIANLLIAQLMRIS